MFARIKKSGSNRYLQIVENHQIKGKVVQRVVGTLGRLELINEKGGVETWIRSLSRFSDEALMVLAGKSEVSAQARKMGLSLIFNQ